MAGCLIPRPIDVQDGLAAPPANRKVSQPFSVVDTASSVPMLAPAASTGILSHDSTPGHFPETDPGLPSAVQSGNTISSGVPPPAFSHPAADASAGSRMILPHQPCHSILWQQHAADASSTDRYGQRAAARLRVNKRQKLSADAKTAATDTGNYRVAQDTTFKVSQGCSSAILD